MSTPSNLDVVISIVKTGDGDTRTITSLKAVAAEQKAFIARTNEMLGATANLESGFRRIDAGFTKFSKTTGGTVGPMSELKAGSILAASGIDLLHEATARSVGSMARHIGLEREAVMALTMVRHATHAAAGGFLALSAAIGYKGAEWLTQWYVAAEQSGRAATTLEDRLRRLKTQMGIAPDVKAYKVFEAEAAAVTRQLEVLNQIQLDVLTAGARAQLLQRGVDFETSMADQSRTSANRLADLNIRRSRIGAASGSAANRAEAQQAYQASLGDIGSEVSATSRGKDIAAEAFSTISAQRKELAAALRSVEEDLASSVPGSRDGKKLWEEYTRLTAAARDVETEFQKIADTLDKQTLQLELLKAKQADIKKEAEATLKIRLAEIDADEKKRRDEAQEKFLSVQKEFRSALEEQFELEAKLKGVEDDRAVKAYSYLQIAGRSAEAARLLSLELDKQNRSLDKQVSSLQIAGGQIARLGRDQCRIAGQSGRQPAGAFPVAQSRQ